MNCDKCQKEIDEDSKFCDHCGSKVEESQKENKTKDKEKALPQVLADVKNHIEFIGYEVEEVEPEDSGVIRLYARHKSRSNLIISYLPSIEALIFVSNFKYTRVESEIKKNNILKTVNEINNNLAIITSFSVGSDFDTVSISSWYPSDYSKKNFSDFLEIFENEISRLLANEEFQKLINK